MGQACVTCHTGGTLLLPPRGGGSGGGSGDGTPDAARRRRHALLIGINYRGSEAELKGCHNDVDSMCQMLTRVYGFTPGEILRLLDNGVDAAPTRNNILKCMSWMVSPAEPGDSFFFHYSGHGAQQEDPSGEEEDCMDETILPVDFMQAGQITDDQLFQALCSPLPSGAKLTAIMDCCHSGTGLDLPYNLDIERRGWVESPAPCHSAGHVVLVSGCLDSQTSADSQSTYEAAHGAMTSAFLTTMANFPQSNHVEFIRDLHASLRQGGFSQRPVMTSSQPFNLEMQFDVCTGAVPNANVELGRKPHHRKPRRPKSQWLPPDTPLHKMLVPPAPEPRVERPQPTHPVFAIEAEMEHVFGELSQPIVVRNVPPKKTASATCAARTCNAWPNLLECAMKRGADGAPR